MNNIRERAKVLQEEPSIQQLAVLAQFSIIPSRTYEGCAQIIRYLTIGNGIQGKTVSERVALLRYYQEKFLRQLPHNIGGELFTAEEIFPIFKGDNYHAQDEALGYEYPFGIILGCESGYFMQLPLSMVLLARR